MPTPEEIEAAEAAALDSITEGIQSAAVDGRSVTAMDPVKQLEALDKLKSRENVGTGSAWGRVRKARYVPPSAGPST